MTLAQFLNVVEGLRIESTKGDFLIALTDAFIGLEPDHELDTNPVSRHYERTADTLRKLCNGGLKMSRICANELLRLYNVRTTQEFFFERMGIENNAICIEITEKLRAFGYNLAVDEDHIVNIQEMCAELLLEIIEDISKGNAETFPPLRRANIKLTSFTCFEKAHIKNGFLYIRGEAHKLPHSLRSIENECHSNSPYANALFEVYSEELEKEIADEHHLHETSPRFYNDFIRHTKNYIQCQQALRNSRDIFSDGQEEFDRLMLEIHEAASTAYYDPDHSSGSSRLNAVMNSVQNAELNSTPLLDIRGYITIEVRKGMCHLLVEKGVIISWVKIYEE